MKYSATLYNAQTGHKAWVDLWMQVKALLMAGHRICVEVKTETRSSAQNRLLHATIGEIADQLEWAGAKRSPEVWKRLLMAAWLRTRGESVEILPALDGHGIDVVFERTSKLSIAECSEFQEYAFAWGSERGVRFTAPEYVEAL